MPSISRLKYLQLRFLAKPKCDRQIYKLIAANRYRSILELGIHDIERTRNLIQVAQKFGLGGEVKYTGVDLFEGRPGGPAERPLKQVHQQLKPLGVKLQLVPGDPVQALNRIANAHTRTDLIIVSSECDTASLEQAWFYVPRMLHASSTVLLQPDTPLEPFTSISRLEIERKAERETTRRRNPQAA
ncbi:MAG: hypothetical protein MK108_17260 [Mariniblastus sp.]|nr:hypothetical protein [Mariniblastus sp.]